MESSSLLILLEKVLSGRPGDAHKHSEAFQKLHDNLLEANEATIRAAVLTTRSLEANGNINKGAASKFLNYLQLIKEKKKPIPPDLYYLTFSANPASRRCSVLFHSLIKLAARRASSLKSGLNSFTRAVILHKNQQLACHHKKELKVQKCNSFVYIWLKNLKIKMERALIKWKFYKTQSPQIKLREVLNKAELRYFYIKFLCIERWTNETWNVEIVDQFWGDDDVFHKSSKQRFRRLTPSESFNNTRISEILYYMTSSASHMQGTDLDYRVQALSGMLIKQKAIRSQLLKLVKFMENLNKLRKQLPMTVMSIWNQKFIMRFERLSKLELICEVLSKKISQVKVESIQKVIQFCEDNAKEQIRKNLENLIKNSLKLIDAPKQVFHKMRMHQINHFQKRVKFTKSVLTSVFKSTQNTQKTALTTWKLFKSFKNHSDKAKIVKKFIKSLALALGRATALPLRFPDMIERREAVLMRCVINSCKNLRQVLILSFQKWLKTNRSLISDRRRIRQLVICSLNHIMKNNLKGALDGWRQRQLVQQKENLENSNLRIRKNLKQKTLRSQKASAHNLINGLKNGGLHRSLSFAFRKIVDRTPDNYARKLITGLTHHFLKKLGSNFRDWLEQTRKKDLRLSRRMSEGSTLKSAWNYLNVLILRGVKPYFDKWEEEVQKHKKKLIHNQVRSLKLSKLIKLVPTRVLKVSFNRIAKATSKIEQTLENLYFSMKRKPKHAFDCWRFNAIKSRKLMLLNRLRAEKLCRVMQKVPNKKLRRSFNSVVGTSIKIKHAMRNLIEYIRKRLGHRVKWWKEYCSFCAHAELDLEFRVYRFVAMLNNPAKRPVREAFQAMQELNEPELSFPHSPFTPEADRPIQCQPFTLDSGLKQVAKLLQRQASGHLSFFKARAAEKTCHLIFSRRIQGLQLVCRLQRLGRHPMREALNCINSWKEKVSKALTSLAMTYKARVRISFLKWKSFIDSEMRKGAVHMLKILKIRQAFERILKRTLREASTRMMQGAVRMEYTMEGLVNGLKGIPRKAIRRWNKVIVEIREEELINNLRAHQLSGIMTKIPKRTKKQVLRAIHSTANTPAALKLSISNIAKSFKKIPKQAFEVWKKFSSDVRNRSIINDYNMQIVKNNLDRIVRRTMRDATKLLTKKPKSIKKTISFIISSIQKGRNLAFINWLNFVKLQQQKDLIAGLKNKMLHSSLVTLLRKKLRDVFYRVLGGGDKTKGVMQGMLNSLNKIPQKALNKWNKAVVEIREYELKSHIKASKLLHIMSKVSMRTLKDSKERIKGDIFMNSNLQSHLQNLFKVMLKTPKNAFELWKKFCHAQDKNFLLEQLQQTTLLLALNKISSRILRDATLRIVGEGNKVKGAFFIYISAMIRRPKNAFDKWKNYLFQVRHKKLIDNLLCFKLKNFFNKICIRKLRDATQRIIGGGNKIKGAIQNLVSGFRNIPTKALMRWSRYVAEVKEKRLMDNFRSEKLKSRLGAVILRSLRRTFKKIIGDDRTIAILKSMFRWIENIVTNGPKDCFDRWKNATTEAIKQRLKNTIKGQNLEKIFNRMLFRTKLLVGNKLLRPDKKIKQALSLCMKTARKKPFRAFNQLKSFSELSRRKGILNELASEKMKNFLESLLKKIFTDLCSRFQSINEVIITAVNNIANHLKVKPKSAIQKWHRTVESLKNNENHSKISGCSRMSRFVKTFFTRMKKFGFDSILQYINTLNNTRLHFRSFHKLLTLIPRATLTTWRQKARHLTNILKINRIRGQQLNGFFSRLLKHQFLSHYQKSKAFHSLVSRFKSYLRNLNIFLNRKLKQNLVVWFKFTDKCRRKQLLQYLRSQKLRSALEKPFRKTLKDANQRIIGQGVKAHGALMKLVQKAKKKPKPAFEKWRDFVKDYGKKGLLIRLTGQRLNEIMIKVFKNRGKPIFNAMCPSKGKIRSAINTVINNLTNKPKQVIKRWKAAIQYIREKALIDFFRGEKLATFAERVVQRTRNDMFGRVSEKKLASWMVYLNLRWVQKVLQQKPRNAFKKWKDVIEDQKRKNLLKSIKSHRIVQLLGKASRKKLRDYIQRILGEGDKVKGAIKTVVSAIKTKTKDAFNSWEKYSNHLSKQTMFKHLQLQKFGKISYRLTLRTMRDTVKRLLEEEDKVKLAINTVVVNLQVRPRQVIKKWKQKIHLWREKILIKDVQSEKLHRTLQEILKRTLRKSFYRISSVQNNSVIAGVNLKYLNKILVKRPKSAFDFWKDFLNTLKQKQLRDLFIQEKLRNSLGKVPRRGFKASFQRIIGEGSRVRGALKAIYMKISRWPQTAFSQWKKLLDDRSKLKMFTELRSRKLATALNKITARTKQQLLSPIIGKQNPAKKMINDLLGSFKSKMMQSFGKMRENVQRNKVNDLIQHSTAKRLQETLAALVKKRTGKMFDGLRHLVSHGVLKVEKMMKIAEMMERFRQGTALAHWRVVSHKDKWQGRVTQARAMAMKASLTSAVRKTRSSSVKTIARLEKVLKNTFNRGENSTKILKKAMNEKWKKVTFFNPNSRALRRFKAIHLLSTLCKAHTSKTLTRLTKPGVIFRAISKLVKCQQFHQKKAFQSFQENKRKKHIIDKIQAIFKVYKVLKPKPKMMLKGRFEYWKNMEELRIYRLKKKCIMKWIYMSSINYQNSFWKLKYVWNRSYKYFDPKHSLMYRKLSKIAGNYQTRLKQYAHFKLVMYYKTMPYPVRRLSQRETPLTPINMKRKSEHRALAFISRPENIAALSRAHTPVGYRQAFSRAFTPTGFREKTPELYEGAERGGLVEGIMEGEGQGEEKFEWRGYGGNDTPSPSGQFRKGWGRFDSEDEVTGNFGCGKDNRTGFVSPFSQKGHAREIVRDEGEFEIDQIVERKGFAGIQNYGNYAETRKWGAPVERAEILDSSGKLGKGVSKKGLRTSGNAGLASSGEFLDEEVEYPLDHPQVKKYSVMAKSSPSNQNQNYGSGIESEELIETSFIPLKKSSVKPISPFSKKSPKQFPPDRVVERIEYNFD